MAVGFVTKAATTRGSERKGSTGAAPGADDVCSRLIILVAFAILKQGHFSSSSQLPGPAGEELGANQSAGRDQAFASWWRFRPDARPLQISNNRMDYITRPGSHDPPPPDPPVQEEPEYLARYMVTKHSWRGKYKRILCISQSGIVTLDPTTLVVTNSYDLLTDYELAAPVVGNRDDPLQQQALEFTISVRTEGRGKFKHIRFSSRFGALCL
ncbi:hypothetical protein R1sor_018296 [Riccia sorocarpa]|uniref:DnaJ homologue subfamily C GRV2/DNAJC13 N-terminal domain-containing protein n=1 Tax=Riccia sorocarpa TaxID=122646 RepID=A0ABD3ICK3_9MARC